ncbi:MAG: hypothetical protein QOF73_2252 [Thermomicrobiales bacterium]|nr:hypothetical protein [Thermomicrobiales bacterium]
MPRFRVTLLVVALCALFVPTRVVAQEATPVAEGTATGTADLASMALSPADLPWPGFGLSIGETWTAERVAEAHAQATGEDPAAFVAALESAGFVREYRLRLALPALVDPTQFEITVDSYIHEFATAEGAAAGFALLEDETKMADAQDVSGPRKIGDQSEVTRFTGISSDTQVPLEGIDVSFRRGNFYGGVILNDFDWNGVPELADSPVAAPAVAAGASPTVAAVPSPAVDDVETLAEALLARMEDVLANGGPGLSTDVLRFEGPDVASQYDDYDRLDGVTRPLFGESQEDFANRGASYGDATDVYDLELILAENPYYVGRLFGFPSVAAAEEWMTGVPSQMEGLSASYVDVTPLPEELDLGDASAAYSFGFRADEALTTRGYRIYVRVGTVVALLQLDAAPGVSLETMRELASAQVACLQSDGPCAPTAVPADLVSEKGDEATPMPA